MVGTKRCRECKTPLVYVLARWLCPNFNCDRYGGPGRD